MKFLNFALYFLISCLINLGSIQAQEVQSVIDQRVIVKQLDYEVKFTSLMMKLGDQLHQDLETAGHQTSPTHPDFLKGEGIDETLKKSITEYSEFFEKQASLTKEQGSLLKRNLLALNYTKLKYIIKESYVGLGAFVKRKGRGVVTGLIIGTILEFVTMGALYAGGFTSLIPYAMIIPYRPIGIIAITARENLAFKKNLISILGGLESYKAYKKQRRVTLRRLKMNSIDELILPLNTAMNKGATSLDSIAISQNSWWHKTLTLFNIQPSKLSYPSLELFLKNNNINDSHIQWIMRESRLPSYLKSLYLVEHIFNNKDEATVILFKTRFSKSFTRIQNHPSWESAKKWTSLLMQAKEVSTIRALMAEPPPGLGAKQIMALWDEIILPHYSASFTMSYNQYRSLKKEISLLRSMSENELINSWDREFFKVFDEKFTMALNYNLPVCRNPEARALKFLLGTR